MTTVAALLGDAEVALADAGVDNARAEARLLLAHVLAFTTAQVFSRSDLEIDNEKQAAYSGVVARRCEGAPLAHITGMREFWSLGFQVTPATLIPRPDTETLVELALDVFKDRAQPKSVLDLGTGSGCILLTLLTCFPAATGTGIDISADACNVARANARALGLEERTVIDEASWTDGIAGTYDLIVSNPPYIPSSDIAGLSRDVREYEPLRALDGGADGLDAYRALFSVVEQVMTSDTVLIVEIGIGQAVDVKAIGEQAGLGVGATRHDLAGIERALSFYKKGVGIAGVTG